MMFGSKHNIFFDFSKIYDHFKFCKTTTVISDDVWIQTQYYTTVVGATVFQPTCGMVFVNSDIVAPPTAVPHNGRVQFVFMDSNEDKIYMKIVAFDKIYNFVVQTFFI
jgi:hypothetical protein